MLEVSDVTSGYGAIMALSGVSLRVSRGQMVALIGSNGAGKTTLLNTVSGIVKPKSGKVSFAGQPITRLAPHRIARMGIMQVPEGRQIFGPLSVEENLNLGQLATRGRGGAEAADLERVFTLFPVLRERRRQRAGDLSGGQQQMLAIGRTLLGRPELLLLDEPSLGLAPLLASQVFAALEALNRDGLTILLVEQNARRALQTAQFAYVLERGRIVNQGPTARLREDPAILSHYLGQHPAASSAPLH